MHHGMPRPGPRLAPRHRRIGWWILALIVTTGPGGAGLPAWATPPDGAQLYQRHCASCHGPTGKGDGPSAELFGVKPRNLRDGFLDKYTTDEIVARVREGRPLELGRDLRALRERSGEVEAIVTHLKRVAAADDWMALDDGWGTYLHRCAPCHGPFGRPTEPFPPGVRSPRDLADPAFQRSVTDAALLDAVRHGREGMPAITPRLTEAQAEAVVVFLRMLSPGFELYSRYCAQCHGDDGQAPPMYDPGLPKVAFDREYFAKHDPEEVRRAVWHMLEREHPTMPHLRWTVSIEDTRAIVEYLKPAERSPPLGHP
jgi:mono/diheme cytochrome c family protein